jgi:photosystem II stability/assembly factor-like uncharacterized protein
MNGLKHIVWLFVLTFLCFHVNAQKWYCLGPFVQTLPDTNSRISPHGIGKVQCIHAYSKKHILVGTNSAGVWETKNGGKSWKSIWNFDYFIGIQDIEVHPKVKKCIYVATGSNTFNDKNYGIGVLKTENGGKTWDTTGLRFEPSEYSQVIVRKVKFHPRNPEILFACTDEKVYRTMDAGESWDEILFSKGAGFRDLEIDPFSDSIVHVSGRFWYKSTNLGGSWTMSNELLEPISLKRQKDLKFERIELAYSKIQKNVLFALYRARTPRIKMSVDGGETWTNILRRRAFLGGITIHNMELAILESEDSTQLIIGGVRAMKVISIHTGQIVQIGRPQWRSSQFVHDDVRDWDVSEDGTLFMANDGGVAISDNAGASWEHVTGEGLTISQFYGISNCEQMPYLIAGGTQDMSSQVYRDDVWYNTSSLYGDGGRALQHPELVSTLWVARSGVLYKTNDTGKTWRRDHPPTGGGPFNSIIKYNTFTDALYLATNDLWEKKEGVWHSLTSKQRAGRSISAFAISPSNGYNMMIGYREPSWDEHNLVYKLMLTDDGGKTWSDYSARLPILAWRYTTDLLYHPVDDSKMWISLGLFDGVPFDQKKSNKVYYSEDRGLTWTNWSFNLPNFPVNCLNFVNGYLFAGTDIGLYYLRLGQENWRRYGEGLPNVYISEIKYNHAINKLRVSTFGMGVWETEMID